MTTDNKYLKYCTFYNPNKQLDIAAFIPKDSAYTVTAVYGRGERKRFRVSGRPPKGFYIYKNAKFLGHVPNPESKYGCLFDFKEYEQETSE